MASATADYALRAVIFLSRQPSGQLVSADEIASAIGAPRNYLSKTLNTLVKAGLAISAPGRCGGFAIAQSPSRLSLDRIVRVFEPETSSVQCMLGNRPCSNATPCRAHRRWREIDGAYEEALASTTVGDLIAD